MSASGCIEVFARLSPGSGLPDLVLPRTILNAIVDSPRIGMEPVSSLVTSVTVPTAAPTAECARRFFVYCSLVDGESSATGKVSVINAAAAEVGAFNFSVSASEPFFMLASGLVDHAASGTIVTAQIKVQWISGGKFQVAIGYFGDT